MFFLYLLACQPDSKSPNEPTEDGEILKDEDGDGYFSDEDCDDSDPAINPETQEICDGMDNNCNNLSDEDVTETFFVDSDEDGFGNPNISTQTCDVPSGYTTNGSDCDDTQVQSHPGAEELCDNLDNDCNGEIDDGIGQMFYVDEDEDGFGDDSNQQESCDLRLGLSSVAGDCNDSDPNLFPSNIEICDGVDNNCNDEIDENVSITFYLDTDEDGFGSQDDFVEGCEIPEGYVEDNLDCDDSDSLINPLADEYCDTVDNDCDGTIDEDYAINSLPFYADLDGDGYGDADTMTFGCTPPVGYVENSDDCDDGNNIISPQSSEFCNELDDNCDGQIDEIGAINSTVYYLDGDNDGFGIDDTAVSACELPVGYATQGNDCDDNDNDIHPNAQEICDEIDNNCNDDVDDNPVDILTYYTDSDNDGFGDSDVPAQGCIQPEGTSLIDGDCDDEDTVVHPNMIEVCDEKDNDCNEDIDDNPVDILTYYTDSDNDGFGDSDVPAQGCIQPEGTSLIDGDCDDEDSVINPAMIEICDEKDNDCNGDVDDGSTDSIELFIDDDGDGFGTDASMELHCSVLDNYVLDGGDCDDDNDNIHPNQPELCSDTIDNNCDTFVDDGTSIDASLWYLDSDEDTYGDEGEILSSCSQPEGYVTDNTDCDDDNDNIHPMADEYCNEIDDDCDDILDNETAVDASLWYLDSDEDTYGDEGEILSSCSQPEGYVTNNTDCDDSNTNLTEVCYFGSCEELLAFDPNTPSGTYTIDVDGTYFDVYCDMTTDDGGWTAVAKQIDDGQSCDENTPKNPLTTVSDLSNGYSLWLVPESLAQEAQEILFYDIPTQRWAVAELTDLARGFLSIDLVDASSSVSNVINVDMNIVRHSGYRTCGYNQIDHAAQGYMFDFADGYGWHGTGFGLCRTTNPDSVYGAFYDSPLINSTTVSYSCTNAGYYYISAGVVFYIR
jgi:large repetitive protein